MKRRILVLLLAFSMVGAVPAAAQQRYIVTGNGLSSVLNLCALLGCQVQGNLDGSLGKTFLVTSATNLISGVVNFLEELLGITSIEPDQVLPLIQPRAANAAGGLYDTTPVNYYGSVAWGGYVNQPATSIIRLVDTQRGFNVSGQGIVAVIDTGVDTNHPVLYPVLLPGYDFTRNQPGASEWLDVPGMQNGVLPADDENQQPAVVQQSTVAVLDKSTVAVLDGGPYSAFGHGTMTTGLVHLVAPTAQILPLKAFSSNGTGNLSNIIAALYYAVQHNANVVNMSFDLTSSSPALAKAISYANNANVVLVAAAGNEDTSARVYPAAFNGQVAGIASTSDTDQRSSFSNFGSADVWIAAPGENIVSTFPGGTYASASGTSFSSPIVAGTVALMRNVRSSINQSQANSALAHAQQLTPDLNHGRLDTFQAVGAWSNTYTSNPNPWQW